MEFEQRVANWGKTFLKNKTKRISSTSRARAKSPGSRRVASSQKRKKVFVGGVRGGLGCCSCLVCLCRVDVGGVVLCRCWCVWPVDLFTKHKKGTKEHTSVFWCSSRKTPQIEARRSLDENKTKTHQYSFTARAKSRGSKRVAPSQRGGGGGGGAPAHTHYILTSKKTPTRRTGHPHKKKKNTHKLS